MKTLFKPATFLMDRLRYPMKFSLIFVIVLTPLLILSSIVINSMHGEIEILKHERMGLEYIRTIRLPVEHIQQHRGMTAALLSGSEEFRSRIMEKRKDVDKYMQQLAEVDRKLGGQLKTGGLISDLQNQWENIKANSMNQDIAVTVKAHSKLIADMIKLMGHVADSSEMTLGTHFDRLYMGAALVNSLPNMIENMGQARAVGSGVAAKGQFAGNSFVRLSVLSNNIDTYLDTVRSGLHTAYEHNPEVAKDLRAPTEANNNAVTNMQNLLRDKLLSVEKIEVSSAAVFDAATQAISGSYKLYDQLAPELDRLLHEDINADSQILWTSLAIVILVLSVVAYLFAGLYLSIRSSIDSIGQATERLAAGDLTTRVTLSSRDEMGEIANYFNGMVEKFSCLIQKITGATGQLATASEEVSVIAREGASNVDRQRQETEQVATAINEMTATVQDVANNASEAAGAANRADEEANGGKGVVESAASVISELASEVENAATVIKGVESHSNEIGKVLDVIKSIAEQTNLLALNAAIEAARAGEQGRGFAVVADEVRTLASRTQESTYEIEQMIDKLQNGARNAVKVMESSRTQAQTGVEQANEAARALVAIAAAVNTIRDYNTQIASAAEEQSVVSEEINQNIHSISDISEQTAVGSEQTTAAANELAQLAADLQAQVSQFKTSCS